MYSIVLIESLNPTSIYVWDGAAAAVAEPTHPPTEEQ